MVNLARAGGEWDSNATTVINRGICYMKNTTGEQSVDNYDDSVGNLSPRFPSDSDHLLVFTIPLYHAAFGEDRKEPFY